MKGHVWQASRRVGYTRAGTACLGHLQEIYAPAMALKLTSLLEAPGK